MRVKDLKELLNTFEDDRLVVMASEPGGGSFNIVDVDINSVRFKSVNGFGEIYIDQFTDDLKEQGYIKEEFCNEKGAKKAIVLWPTG